MTKNLSDQEFQEKLKLEYQSSSVEDLKRLILDTSKLAKDNIDLPFAQQVIEIAMQCWQSKDITFSQWKCLSVFYIKNRDLGRRSLE